MISFNLIRLWWMFIASIRSMNPRGILVLLYFKYVTRFYINSKSSVFHRRKYFAPLTVTYSWLPISWDAIATLDMIFPKSSKVAIYIYCTNTDTAPKNNSKMIFFAVQKLNSQKIKLWTLFNFPIWNNAGIMIVGWTTGKGYKNFNLFLHILYFRSIQN